MSARYQPVARKRCYNHPHRESEQVCVRCRIAYCDECLTLYDGEPMCANCIREVKDAKAAQVPTGVKVRRKLRSYAITFGIIAALALISVPSIFLLGPLLRGQEKLSPVDIARMRYAAAGSYETEDGIDVASAALGAIVVSRTSENGDYPATHLIDEATQPNYPGWRSQTATFPMSIVIDTQGPDSMIAGLPTISKVILTENPSEPPETFVRGFEVWGSTVGADAGFLLIDTFEMPQSTGPQRFTFTPMQARYVKLRILGNWGSQDYVSLDEFGAYVVSSKTATNTAPTATPKP